MFCREISSQGHGELKLTEIYYSYMGLSIFTPATSMGINISHVGGSIGIVLFSPLCQAFGIRYPLGGVVSLIKSLAVLSIRMNVQYKSRAECRTVTSFPTNRHADISLGPTIVHTCQKEWSRASQHK